MRNQELLTLLGKLIKRERASRMDQEEFATRIGCGVNTVYRIENGKPVNAATLFAALDLLELIDPFIEVSDNMLSSRSSAPLRKRAKATELYSNDF